MNLALTVPNICSSIVGTIPTIASMIDGKWPLGKPFCYAIGTLGLIFTLLRYTSVLAITVDRFGAVMCPFQYPKHGAQIAAVIFSVGILYATVPSLVYDVNVVGCYNFNQGTQMCVPQIQCNEAFCYVFNIFQALTIIVLGTVVPLILTILMFHKAKKLGTTVASGTIGNVEMVDPGAAEVRSRNIRASSP